MKIVKIIVCVLFGLMFINAGLNKFFNYMPMQEMTKEQMDLFGAIMKITWLMPLTGIVEIIGGLLFAIPKTRALGAIVILPVMVGILANSLTLDHSTLPMVSVLALINLWMIVDNWDRYKPMVA